MSTLRVNLALAAVAALLIAGPARAQTASPWPQIEADPALVEQIRAASSPFYPLGAFDLTVIPPATEPARRAAWLDERYGRWLELAGAQLDSWTRPPGRPIGGSPNRRARDPRLEADLKALAEHEAAAVGELRATIDLATAARAAVKQAEEARLAVEAGRAKPDLLQQANAARDAAESAFHRAERTSGITTDPRSALYAERRRLWDRVGRAEAEFELAAARDKIAADRNFGGATVLALDPAELEGRAAEALAAAQDRYDKRIAMLDAQARENAAVVDDRTAVRAQSEGLSYRLVRDAVERGRLDAGQLAAATSRLADAQKALWDNQEVGYEARIAAQAATAADGRASQRARDLQNAFARWINSVRRATDEEPARLARAKLDLANTEAGYAELKAARNVAPEVLEGYARRLEAARAAVQHPAPPPYQLPVTPPRLARLAADYVPPAIRKPTRPATLPVLPPPGLGVVPPLTRPPR